MGFWYVSIRQNGVIETNIFVVEKKNLHKIIKREIKVRTEIYLDE